jgi:predicted amidohydrolase YtcJ
MGRQGEAGRLEVGYPADMVILSGDPTAVPAAAWAAGEDGLAVIATICGGLTVYGEP